MYRYRMSSKPRKTGWIVILVIIGLLLLILAGQLGARSNSNAPSASQAADAGGVLPRLWEDIRDGAVALWSGLTAKAPERQVSIDLGTPEAQGSGDDEEETAADSVTVKVANPIAPEAYVPVGTSPQILIYHTHSHEAYSKQDGQNYVEVAKWRTTNNAFNVAKVGDELARQLAVFHGIAALHDVTDNEYPKLGTSYTRSLKTVQKDMAENSGLKILVDLHRDAYNAGIDPSVVTINGKKVARIMIVIGTGEGQTGVGFTERPDYQKNMLLAKAITDRLNEFDPNLARKVDVKTGRYNQHVSTGAVLIEVGHNENTLDEALAAVPFLAQALADAYETMMDYSGAMPGATAMPSSAPTPPVATASPTQGEVMPVGLPTAKPSSPPQQIIVIEPEATPARTNIPGGTEY